jgi:hypothetical protein
MKSDMPHQSVCPFCNPAESKVILANTHTLIIPKRHIASFFEASREEAAMIGLLVEMSVVRGPWSVARP